MIEVCTKDLGTVKCWKIKPQGTGLLIWLYCNDGLTQMPDPVRVLEWW